jgi:hypothetical protein
MIGGNLTYDDLVLAAANVGVDLRCGRCACVFYTGGGYPGPPPHDPGCATAAQEARDRHARADAVWAFEEAARRVSRGCELYRDAAAAYDPKDPLVELAHTRYVAAVRAYEAARAALMESP